MMIEAYCETPDGIMIEGFHVATIIETEEVIIVEHDTGARFICNPDYVQFPELETLTLPIETVCHRRLTAVLNHDTGRIAIYYASDLSEPIDTFTDTEYCAIIWEGVRDGTILTINW